MICTSYKNKILREIQNGNIKFFQETLEKYPHIHWSQICYEKTGDTILHCAARLGFVDVIKYILSNFSAKAVDCKNNDDKTALHEGAQFSQFACCELLLKFGAEVNALKRADWTPLMLACTKVTDNSFKTVEVLLKYGAAINYRNKDGWTPLHLVSREGDLEILNLLIKYDLDIKLKTKNGRSALHVAALHNNFKIVERLIELGLNIEEIDRCGNTPLHEAALGKNVEICRLLIKNNANVHCKNSNGFLLIHLAASEGDNCLINFVVNELKMDVNVRSNNGWTALHCAARKGRRDNYDYLLQCGSDKTIKDIFGRSAEEYII